MIKKLFILFFVVSIIMLSCNNNKEASTVPSELPTIDENTETEITIWAWNVAARALTEMADIFMQKYPKIKVNVQEFGGVQAYEKYGVVLASGKEIPDIMQIESDYVQTFTETYPQRFMDLRNYINIEGQVDPSKISTSYDSEGRLVSIPWDSGPVAMFYRADMFQEAGIDPNSIVTYDDFIKAGKQLQEKFPNVKMTGFPYSRDDNLWRCLLVQNEVYFLNSKGEITISSDKAVESISMLKRFIDEGIAMNTVNWDSSIMANKNGDIASYIIGGWWGGTIKDQMPEMKGKWKIMPIPAFITNGLRASSLGGSDLSITATDPIKQAAAIEFIKQTLMNVDNQIIMYEKYGLFPSYLPAYDDPRFLKSDDYFGDDYNSTLANITKEIPQVIYTTKDYAEIRNVSMSSYEEVLNNNADIKKTLDNAASQINSATGRTIAK
ncbi:extracellular solute-binding protein [Brachyspira intermedia]|uniref:ABC transporter substrate-binding protein n=1 Tax=Brachyspira intermedia TaxID=84377 RepID=UPI003006CCFD